MVKKSKTPLLNEFKAWLIANFGEIKGYCKDIYLTPRSQAVPDEYIGDDITEDIRCMYSRPLNFISDKLMEEKRTVGEYAVPMVDASWEDSTGFALMYKNRVLFKNYMKAWHFYYESEKDFEEFLQGIWDDCIKALEQIVDDEDLYRFEFTVRQCEYEHSYRKLIRAKSEEEALKIAKKYLRDFYGEESVEVAENGMVCRYNGGELIGEFDQLEKIDLKRLVDILTIEG